MTRYLALGVLAVLAAGCGMLAPKAKVASGTKIPLALAQVLVAGDAQKGDLVRLIVAEDVVVDGKTVIAAGAPATAGVTWSRGESMLSGLSNQPARLVIQFESVTAVDGTQIVLRSEDPKEGFAFNRGNTGRTQFIENLERAVGKEDAKVAIESLRKRVENGEKVDLDGPELSKTIESLSAELDLKQLGEAATNGKLGELADIANSLRTGAAVATGNLSIAGAMQAISLVESAGSRLDRMLRGRTIRAFPGTPVLAIVDQEVEVAAK